MTDETVDQPSSQNGGSQDEADVFLLIPASSREGFTERVCGLPGNEEGCWRYREVTSQDFLSKIENIERGIEPTKNSDQSDLVAWLSFELEHDHTNDDQFRAVFARTKPDIKPGYHQMLFGFTTKGLEVLKKINREEFRSAFKHVDFPNYVEYWGWSEEENRHLSVRNWLREESGTSGKSGMSGLSDYFGRLTFVRKPIPEINIECALSDLLREYLNHNKGCRFRREPDARSIGITLCKTDINMRKIFAGTNMGDESLFDTCAINFSYADPDTLDIKPLPEWNIGCNDGFVKTLQDDSVAYFKPLPVFRGPDTESDDINFAMSLSRDGRHFILPSEVGKSFLSFPVGELASYLLHWFLLRIFADNSEPNVKFVTAFEAWREALYGGSDQHHALFIRLLEMPVTLPLDENVYTENVLTLDEKGKYLGVYPEPTPLGETLWTLGLGTGESSTWIQATIVFLRSFFSAQTADDNLRSLPMYQPLHWDKHESLDKADSGALSEKIEAIFACMANASGLTTAEAAQSELRKHVQRCVFPIGEVLATLPFDNKLPLYYIFPLWEDMIKGQRRPIVFAHVFTRALMTKDGSSSSFDRQEIFSTGAHLQRLLLPAGAAVAHDFYNRERKKIERSDQERKIAWTQAMAWAHEVKNYTSPIISDLSSSVLTNATDVTSEEARNIISRSRRAMIILNAASKAIQLSISNRALYSKPEEKLERLPRKYARNIVSIIIQYLLNYRAEVMKRDFIIKWSPYRSTEQSLTDLIDVLKEIKGKEKTDVEALGDVGVIWVIALLREVFWNIRLTEPYGEPVVNISYDFSEEKDVFLVLNILQKQVEEGKKDERQYPLGVRMANELLGVGAGGAGFGSIEFFPTLSQKRADGKGVDVVYHSKVTFAMSE